jgi:5'-nucleotidase
MDKTILITNDDGFESKGLHALIDALKPLANVVVVAPTVEKSACGHSLTLTRPLRFVEIEPNFYKLDDGTPSDCVFLSLQKIFKEKKPDLVVSGINKGANLGEDITYSGTAAAAMEAVLQGIPAVAISQVCKSNCKDIDSLEYKLAKKTIYDIANKILNQGYPLPERKFLNINIPPLEKAKGIKITHAGKRAYGNDAEVHYNPRGLEYYWIGLPKIDWTPTHNPKHELSDIEAIRDDYISITPVQLDMTHYESIKKLQEWL